MMMDTAAGGLSPSSEVPSEAGGPAKRSRKRRDKPVRVRLQEDPREFDSASALLTAPEDPEASIPTSPQSKNISTGLTSALNVVKKVGAVVSTKKPLDKDTELRRRASRRKFAASMRRKDRGSGTRPPLPPVSGSAGQRGGSFRAQLVKPNGQLNPQDDAEQGMQPVVQDPDPPSRQLVASQVIMVEKKTVRESVVAAAQNAWRQFQLMTGIRTDEIRTVEEVIKEPILEDLELPHRYRPDNLKMLCETTGFSVSEMKRIYRAFKTECPSGLMTEEVFHGIYSRFFPHGANLSSYSHYIFSTLDQNDSGVITFEDFVVGLSILIRGSLEDKLCWAFSLYDQDRDGFISREEMEDVVGSVFDLMGGPKSGDPILEEEMISERVDKIFEKMDLNKDGVVSLDEFLTACQRDETICQSLTAFHNPNEARLG